MLTNRLRVSLALLAFPSKPIAVCDHCRPVVSVTLNFYSERSSAGVVPARPGVDFFHHFLGLGSFYASHEWTREPPFVNFPVDGDIRCCLGFDFSGCPFLLRQCSVDDVGSDYFQPRFFAAVLGLFRIFLGFDLWFFGVLFMFSDEISDDRRSDARMLDKLF